MKLCRDWCGIYIPAGPGAATGSREAASRSARRPPGSAVGTSEGCLRFRDAFHVPIQEDLLVIVQVQADRIPPQPEGDPPSGCSTTWLPRNPRLELSHPLPEDQGIDSFGALSFHTHHWADNLDPPGPESFEEANPQETG